MVALNQDLVISGLMMVSLLFYYLDNHQEIPIVRLVLLFGARALTSIENDWAKDPESVVLVKDAGDCEPACIALQNDCFLPV
jgi:hypothetical protein